MDISTLENSYILMEMPFPFKWRDFLMLKYPFFPGGTCPYVFLKDVRRFSTKQIKCRYLYEINEKFWTGINGYFYIKNPLL